jgi:hypothetical protein
MIRKTAFISVGHLTDKEFLRYELLMQIADEKTVFRWVLSDMKNASVALLNPLTFNARETLPVNCICIWISESAGYAGRKGDMTLPVNFRIPDLIDALDRAALRMLDKKIVHVGPDSEPGCVSQRTYRISKWINLEHDFSTIRFQKILTVMTKQTVNWHWLLTSGDLTTRDAYLFLEELRKKNVLVERDKVSVVHESPQQISLEQKDSSVGLFVKKISQWLGRARSQDLERIR